MLFMPDFFIIVGAAGLLFISVGIVAKNEKRQDVIFIIGGVCLEIYSIHIRDLVFIILQAIFISVGIYELIKLRLK